MGSNSHFKVGVLALQGDYEQHERQLESLGARSSLVKLPQDLEPLDALIIPGGESTTMNILIDRFHFRQPLLDFADKRPVYGTCAGMILLSKRIEDNRAGVEPLGLIDLDVDRNGYGRQVFSFETTLRASLNNGAADIRVAFIRAPKATRLGPGVRTLAVYQDSPVLVAEGNCLAASFHAELDDDARLLSYFLSNFVADKTGY